MSDSVWPSAVSGVIGFVGVLAGLGWNAWQVRKTEDRQRANTRTALRTSLQAELVSLANLMESEIAYIESSDFTWIPLIQSFKVYVANLQNLGLLQADEVRKITEAYYQYQESAGYIVRLAEDHPELPGIGRHIQFDFKKIDKKSDVISTLHDIASKARTAAQEIQAQLSRMSPTPNSAEPA